MGENRQIIVMEPYLMCILFDFMVLGLALALRKNENSEEGGETNWPLIGFLTLFILVLIAYYTSTIPSEICIGFSQDCS